MLKRSLLTASGFILALATTIGCLDGAKTEPGPGPTQTSTSAAGANCTEDAGCGNASLPAKATTVSLNGRACSITRTALDMGLDGNGWTAMVDSDDCGFIVEVSGLDDQPYPQTSLTAVLGEDRIKLFTNEGIDGGIGGTYLSNHAAGSVTIERGPVQGSPRSIAGKAHVIGEDGVSAHDLVFDLTY